MKLIIEDYLKILFAALVFYCSNTMGMTILIDPGHGGIEEGAIAFYRGKKVMEKDLTLKLAHKLYIKLKKTHNVYLTRSVDRTVTLMERAQIAERVNADFMISIHLNSTKEKNATGFEIFYLDNHKDVAVKKIEKVENLNHGLDLEVQKVLTDLVVDQTVHFSKPIANTMESLLKKHVTDVYKIPSRGVKPALFYVLALSKRPSVLLEVAFLSNPKDLKNIMNHEFQEDFIDAVSQSILKSSKTF